MPPRIKKKKRINILPPLSFIASPTPSTIRFPNSGYSQSQPLEVPTVPYTEGGKWLTKQFTQLDTRNVKLPSRRRKLKSDFSEVPQSSRKCAVVSGCEPHQHTSKRRSSTSYVPLEVIVSARKPFGKRRSLQSREGKSDDVANNSSRNSADETFRAVNLMNDNSMPMQSEKMEDFPPIAFSVKTPLLESSNLESASDKTLQLRRTCSLSNLQDLSHSDVGLHDVNEENYSPKHEARRTLRLFQSSDSEDSDLQEAEILAPDTPEHEMGLTFFQRRLKERYRGVKQPG